jgi:myo-inositol-1-phosphate synthase
MAPTNFSSGYNTPDNQLESLLPVHPTAARRPYPVVVQSENTQYSDEHITSTFNNRGTNVSLVDGQCVLTPTVQAYQFQTARKVGKTGLVLLPLSFANTLFSRVSALTGS